MKNIKVLGSGCVNCKTTTPIIRVNAYLPKSDVSP